jgi:hypothetical protein
MDIIISKKIGYIKSYKINIKLKAILKKGIAKLLVYIIARIIILLFAFIAILIYYIVLRFCASTCSASTDQAKLANLGYLGMRSFIFPTSFLSFV